MDHSNHSSHDSHADHSGHMDHSSHGSHSAVDPVANHSVVDSHVDHSTMDHSSHDSHAGHQMKMWFHGGTTEVILFDFWRIESGLGLVISFLLIFALGALYEGLKWFRLYLQVKETRRLRKQRRALSPPMSMNQLEESVNKRLGAPHPPSEALLSPSGLNGDQVYVSTVKEAEDDDTTDVGFFKLTTKKPLDKSRIIQALLYCVQITLAYFLMLIAMTYNIWLTAAVVLGAGFGHWLFAALQDSDANAETADAIQSDACH